MILSLLRPVSRFLKKLGITLTYHPTIPPMDIYSEKTIIEKDIRTPMFIVEKAMAPHSSTLAWKIPWMEEPGGLLSMGSHRVGHD